MRLILVESPFMFRHRLPSEARLGLLRNVTYARLAIRDCALRGEAGYASHLFYTQPLILDDDVTEERSLGIAAGLAWGDKADATALYLDLGVSGGMRLGLERAGAAGRPVEERSLSGWSMAADETPFETLDRLALYSVEQLERVARGDEGPFGTVPSDPGFAAAASPP